MSTISTPINNRLRHAVSELPYLRGLKLAHPGNGDYTFTISMLIVVDFYWDIVEDHIVRGNGPTAVKSKIGYLLSGPVHTQQSRAIDHVFNVIASHMPTDVLECFWSLESMGISQNPDNNDKSDYFREYQQSSIRVQERKLHSQVTLEIRTPTTPEQLRHIQEKDRQHNQKTTERFSLAQKV